MRIPFLASCEPSSPGINFWLARDSLNPHEPKLLTWFHMQWAPALSPDIKDRFWEEILMPVCQWNKKLKCKLHIYLYHTVLESSCSLCTINRSCLFLLSWTSAFQSDRSCSYYMYVFLIGIAFFEEHVLFLRTVNCNHYGYSYIHICIRTYRSCMRSNIKCIVCTTHCQNAKILDVNQCRTHSAISW